MLYKLGDINKLDIEKDIENKIKELKENNSTHFEVHEGISEDDYIKKSELKPIGAKLEQGSVKTFTKEQVAKMSAEEINQNWEQIKEMNLG